MMLTNDIKIEPLSLSNLADAIELEKMSFNSYWGEKELKEELSNKSAKFYVAYIDKKAVAYVGLYVVLDEADIARVAVHKDYRKMGIGKILLNSVFEMQNGLNFVFLDVRQSNVPAIKLYESLNFENIGVRKNYYSNPTENAVLMKKTINE